MNYCDYKTWKKRREAVIRNNFWVDERIAIMVFDGGIKEEDAERRAFITWGARRDGRDVSC